MRRAIACTRCRSMKRRCTDLTEFGCRQCVKHNHSCSLVQRQKTGESRIIAAPSDSPRHLGIQFTSDNIQIILDPSTVDDLVQKYIHLIHDRPHSLFHVASLWTDIERGTVPKQLLYSICSLGCSLSKDVELHALQKPLSQEAKRLVQADLENICLANVQTLVLLANICAAELSPSAETLYFGIANRMAHILKLHRINIGEPVVLQETKSRVWWTLYMADHWCSAGLGLPRQLYTTNETVKLPADEKAFQRATMQDLTLPTTSGLWAYMLTLVEIFPDVQSLNIGLVDGSLDDVKADQRVQHISQRLDQWLAGLPPTMRLDEHTFKAHAAKGLGGPFVALHLGYHHYSTLLFFQYLDLQRPTATAAAQEYASRCKFHASAYSDLLKRSRENPGCEAVYATVGHMTVVSSSVLLHMLLFGSEDELDATRAHLNSNFVALIEMRTFWPSLERTISRLSTFQNACLRSVDPNTHRIDKWMVRFLLEHSLPLDDRDTDHLNSLHSDERYRTGATERDLDERERFVTNAMATLWE